MVSNTSTTPASVRAKRSISSITAPERLKSALKEKEQKIEQLQKERELERAEIAKAALQTDEAESQLVHIKREYLSYKGEICVLFSCLFIDSICVSVIFK